MTHHDDHLDDSLRPLADALDSLGRRERDSAPRGLEQRLLAGTLPILHADAHADTPDDSRDPVIARIGLGRALRIAAAIALVAFVGVATLSILRAPNPAPTSTDPTTEALLSEIDTETDDWLADLDALQTTADSSSTSTTDFWSLPDEDSFDSLLGEENS